jgi:hypothetical protein
MNFPLLKADQSICPFSKIYEWGQFVFCPTHVDCPIYALKIHEFSNFCFLQSISDTTTRQKIYSSFFNLKYSVTVKPHVKISMLEEEVLEDDFFKALSQIHQDQDIPLFITSTGDPQIPANLSDLTNISDTKRFACFHYLSLLPFLHENPMIWE